MNLSVSPPRRLAVAVLLVLSGLVSAGLLNPARPHAALAAGIPAGLPTHFGVGLSAAPDNSGIYGWMPNSGIPWDYAYQYLSGGTNTGSGWETWNSSGQFALYYAQGAASHGYIPVFSYYELLQSNGTCGSCGEAQKDLSNLNNASTMSSYFQNFKLLMQRLGSGTYGGIAGFGKTAIVHVDPDLSGYAENAVLNNSKCYGYCTGQGNNPANLQAAVASSGFGEVAGYPNTYQGFNWALLHLRDLYAPNVLLAFHVSDWATATDVGSSTDSSVNAAALGQEAGSFAAQSGIAGVPSGTSSYDLLFNDVSDRDAAYYKYVYGDSSRWWDRLNVTFPNFHRWESYVSAASQAAGRKVIVWQVPEGNQYFDTENNTNGHYQDNRAEYFFGHIAELAQSGIIGMLFGAGNGGSTVQSDGMNDGITNPASFCTSDGMSSGQICNNHTSTVADDDGGYIRMQGQQYYASGGYTLGGGNSSTATPTATDTPIPASSPTATSTSSGSGSSTTLGLTSVGSTADSGDANDPTGSKITTGSQPETVSSVSGYVGQVDSVPHNQYSFAIYSDASGSPGTLLAQSGTGTLVANGWNTLPINATLQPNTSYWLMYNSNGSSSSVNNLRFNNVGTNLGAYSSNGQSFGSWPTSFGGSGLGGWQYSLYATVSTGSTSPSATSTPTSTSVPPTATNTPTSTPTDTPVPPTATSTASGAPSVTITGAGASPTSVTAGTSTTLSTTVTASQAISGAIIDFEVYNSSGAKIYQTYQSANLAGNTAQHFTTGWAVPGTQAAGSYTLEIGVFGPGWTPTYAWDSNGGTISISLSPATSTPTNTPTAAPTATNTPIPPTATPTTVTGLVLGNFENSTEGYTGNADVLGMTPSTWSPAVAMGNYALLVSYKIPAVWSEVQLHKLVNVDLSAYHSLSVVVDPMTPAAAGAGIKVRFLVQGSSNGWYASSYQTVPSNQKTTVSWNLGSIPRAPLKQLYVCWQYTTPATGTSNQLYLDALMAS